MKREEDEVDLSLSLSIGSNVSSTRPASPPSDTTFIRSDESNGLDSLNPQRKRRLFALRRQEAKNKRIEKKQRQQLNNSNGIPVNNRTCHGNMSAGDRVAKKGRFGNFDQIQYPSLSVVPVPVPVPMTIPMPMPCLYLMPCWAPDVAATASPSISAVGPDGLNSGFLQFERSDSEKNVSSSSSAVSDAESASLQGSSGSDSRSHSEEKPTTSNIMNSTTAKIISTPSSLNKHSHYSPTHRVGDEEKRKLPTPSLPQMPYVWTTGDGPDGKTITGFLYRCTKTEISIVCVCHGSLFSPAEFVRHAGGTDISHPMRHIVVVPSPAFG